MEFPPFQSRQEVVIHAPLQAVWEFGQDLTNIAEYHPRVKRVDLISGKRQREQGVAYRCYLKDGKNTCVEKDLEVVPMERIVTALPEDTMGITNMLPDYIVETRFTPLAENETKVEFRHYYSTKSLKTKLFNVIAKRNIARDSQSVNPNFILLKITPFSWWVSSLICGPTRRMVIKYDFGRTRE